MSFKLSFYKNHLLYIGKTKYILSNPPKLGLLLRFLKAHELHKRFGKILSQH